MLVGLAVTSLAGCVGSGESPLQTYPVFEPGEALNFDHLCSELGNGNGRYWKSFAFFNKPSRDKNYKALALAQVRVGYTNALHGASSVTLVLEKMRIESLSEWSRSNISVHLRMVNHSTGQIIDGNPTTEFEHYTQTGPGVNQKSAYQISGSGELDWVSYLLRKQFRNPQNPEHAEAIREARVAVNRHEAKYSVNIDVHSERVRRPQDAHGLFLVLTNLQTGAEIALEGPNLVDLQPRWESITTKTFKTLGFIETFTPSEEAGFFGWIRATKRYDACRFIAPYTRNQFSLRFDKV